MGAPGGNSIIYYNTISIIYCSVSTIFARDVIKAFPIKLKTRRSERDSARESEAARYSEKVWACARARARERMHTCESEAM